ncbi:MAG: acyl-CoA dehydratase activase, partial [Nitrospinota bacterium]
MMNSKDRYIGLDIGSVSVKGALLDGDGRIIHTIYERSFGQPTKKAGIVLKDLLDRLEGSKLAHIGVTGAGGELVSSIVGGLFVNEIIAQSQTVSKLYPTIKTLVEMGGEDSKMITFKEENNKTTLVNFSMNDLCAAGTGSFLDQQASRMGYSPEEFGQMALKAKRAPRIAGRCSVFAKSDMIHLQQVGTPDYEIISGLCFAVVRSFISNVGRGKEFIAPVGFFGGVSSNQGVVRALIDELNLDESELIVPKYNQVTGAIGAAYTAMESKEEFEFQGKDAIDQYIEYMGANNRDRQSMPVLQGQFNDAFYDISKINIDSNFDSQTKCFIGVDIGSLSTNVVAIDLDNNVIARRYLRTQSRPIEAVTRGLKEIGDEIKDKVHVLGVGTTGSGRYMIADFIGADVVRNEITAQATASIYSNPEVDTIFEIGGQDSKYISVENQAVVDFEMNKVCAAGTGSFIEEQSEKFDLDVKQEFENAAFSSDSPGKFGDRCTVFIESDLVGNQQKGMGKNDLAAGLAYSIVKNYLNRVVGSRKIGNNILFQGGVAWNKAVVAAFESILGKKVLAPPHHDVTGAIGVAMIANSYYQKNSMQPSKFYGFELEKREYKVSTFECKACDNVCDVSRVKFDKDAHFYGARCDIFDSKSARKHKKAADIPLVDLFSERDKLLFGDYLTKKNFSRNEGSNKVRIGIPRALYSYEHFPFWETFLTDLGFEVVLSGKTNHTVIKEAIETVKAETCFPIKIIYGHVLDLMKKEVDYIFLPSTITASKSDSKFQTSQTCPMVQSSPYLLRAAIDYSAGNVKELSAPVFFQRGVESLLKELGPLFKSEFNIKKGKLKTAIQAGIVAQDKFHLLTKNRGKEVINQLKSEGERPVVLISRSYNGCDSGLNLDLPRKLLAMNKVAIPLDFLDLKEDEVVKSNPDMYWKSGQKMLSACDYIKNDPEIDAIMLSSFNCGPDSFINYHIEDRLKGKPFLSLEIDEHSADAGAITRCEAYFDSLDNFNTPKIEKQAIVSSEVTMECGAVVDEIVPKLNTNGSCNCNGNSDVKTQDENGKKALVGKNGSRASSVPINERKIHIPYMCDHGYTIVARLRKEGIDAQVLPVSDQASIDFGLKYVSGKECIPFVMTTGDMIKKAKEEGFSKDSNAFFMPTTNGPCRFGQYQSVQKMLLEELGIDDVPLLSLDSKNGYNDEHGFAISTKMRRDIWRGVVAVDILLKLTCETRPYEVNKGETDETYQRMLAGVVDILEKEDSSKLFEWMEVIKHQYKKIEIKDERRPIIGVVGEIYLRSHAYGNQDVVRRIEQLGGEVWIAPIAEWMLYCTNRYIENSKNEKKYLDQWKGYIQDIVQKRDEKRLYEPFKDTLRNGEEIGIKQVLANAAPYMHHSFEGEAVLSIGKAVEYAQNNISGVVNIMPFSCMPGS